MPAIAATTGAAPGRNARRIRSISASRPANPGRSGGSVSWTRTCADACASPPITRSACRHWTTYPTSGCNACTTAITRSVFSRRRPALKQSATVALRASSPPGRPVARHASLIRSLIMSYDGLPAQTFSWRNPSAISSRVPARPGSGSTT